MHTRYVRTSRVSPLILSTIKDNTSSKKHNTNNCFTAPPSSQEQEQERAQEQEQARERAQGRAQEQERE